MSFVALDLGASGSRYTVESGKILTMPNNMVFLPDGTPSLITPDAPDIDRSLEVQIEKVEGNECEHFPANVLIGIMAERHGAINERPSANSAKYLQRINYVSTIVACALCTIKHNTNEDIDLYLDVPPLQIHKAREVFSEKLVGKYKVKFPKYMGGVDVNINIKSVTIYEESFMALTSFFFNMNGTIRETSKSYLPGTVLSLDIGASTTDLSITKNGGYLDKSGQTYMSGGNIARDVLADGIRERYTIDLPVEDAEKTMIEGRLQLGNKFGDVSDLVSEAKVSLAKKLVSHVQNYFSKVNIPLTSINAIVVSGGGSVQSQYVNNDGEVVKTSEPMSYYVTQELLKISNGTEVVQYGDEARFANIKGLFIRAKVDQIEKKQAKAVETVANVQQAQAVATPVAPAVASVQQAQAVAPAVNVVTPVQGNVAVATPVPPVVTSTV